jgi:glycosyltransferase involved in cell wall biosynthesis
MKGNIDVSIIIPTYNEERDIGECLKSLESQTFKKFEIIVVDDGSTDKTIETINKFKKIRILKQNHSGPAEARNFGAKNAKGEVLIFIDADMTFDKDYIKNLINPILSDKEKKIIGTTHDYEVADNINNKWSVLWGKVRVDKKDAENVKIFRAIKKEEFLRLGSFDRKYGYADDQTFWFKYKIKPAVAENTICYHKNPETLKSTYKQARWIGASWNERWKIFRIPIIKYFAVSFVLLVMPFAVLIKSFKRNNNIPLYDKIKFYIIKFWGYFIGLSRVVFIGINFK